MQTVQIRLSNGGGLDFPPADSDTPKTRRFSGIANSGRPFGYGDYLMVLDLADIRLKGKTAVLLEHNPNQAAGVAVLSVDESTGSLKAEGELIDNQHGSYITQLADSGFPWEMSVHVEAARHEQVRAGETLTVNGQQMQGPLVVMRGCAVREVSFTPVGADGQTSAVVLSGNQPFTHQFTQTEDAVDKDTPNADLQQKINELEQQLTALQQENAELKKAQKRERVKAKLSQAGFASDADGKVTGISEAMLSALLTADDAAADAMIADLKLSALAAKPPAPAVLFDRPQDGDGGVKLSAATATLTNRQGKQYV